MFDFYQKRKLRAVINSPITQGVILLLALLVGWSAYVRFDIAMEMRDRRVQAELQATALETRKEALRKQVDYLSSERGIEAEMRRQFDVALPGEKVVVIVDEEAESVHIEPLSTTSVQQEKPWYQFWE
jgi:cell division protein FtsB